MKKEKDTGKVAPEGAEMQPKKGKKRAQPLMIAAVVLLLATAVCWIVWAAGRPQGGKTGSESGTEFSGIDRDLSAADVSLIPSVSRGAGAGSHGNDDPVSGITTSDLYAGPETEEGSASAVITPVGNGEKKTVGIEDVSAETEAGGRKDGTEALHSTGQTEKEESGGTAVRPGQNESGPADLTGKDNPFESDGETDVRERDGAGWYGDDRPGEGKTFPDAG